MVMALTNCAKRWQKNTVQFAVQAEQKGTGHAVAQALEQLGSGKVLILYGDVPLLQRESLSELLAYVDEQHMGLLTVTLADPTGYGRIVRDDAGDAVAIVEQKMPAAPSLPLPNAIPALWP
ncbi:hypothetical protein HORIV_73210 [Vreelandella olivaria]|uniref:Nucleotidyl transferase domain-containing protein n=1 Tax=Vreelandella olivaria TaxID=390919 RepID=A0ABM7GVH7_9GAMM|nr:hypothetical protein HORIV_73210 [Halomonas olivaria]